MLSALCVLRSLLWRRQLGGNPTLCQTQQYGAQYGTPPSNFAAPHFYQNPCLPAAASSLPTLAPAPAPGEPLIRQL